VMGREEAEWDRFRREAQALGVALDDLSLGRFRRYLEELREWNEKIRLVGSADTRSVLWLHFYDSLTLLTVIGDARRILDVGSGAGFPGLPLGIARGDLEVCLVEARRKRANFLRHVVRILGLERVSVVEGRIGEGCVLEGEWDLAVARGVAPRGKWLRWVEPFLRDRGKAVLMLGEGEEAGIGEALRDSNWSFVERRTLELPVVGKGRRLLVVRRGDCFT
jgi:16S rRNA (guanine527-N7)-methyltransferase